MTAYYNENDPAAAAWLRELIKRGLIVDGIVDERSIVDVRPIDLRGFVQCHFFAGIGVWSYALRRAGWPDDRPIWTGSCPCQPFSGSGKRGGFDDERHLWPHFHWLIDQCEPVEILGEQVASQDGLAWIDLVQADLEGSSYASGAIDTCAAGFGAPHWRQRLYWFGKWLADSNSERYQGIQSGSDRGLVREAHDEWTSPRSELGIQIGRLGHDDNKGLERQRGGYKTASGRIGKVRPTAPASESSWLADMYGSIAQLPKREGATSRDPQSGRAFSQSERCSSIPRTQSAGPTNGFWRDPDWLFCRDGRWRPVESGTFPLVDGAPARMGRLRGYGNAINAEQAQGFIEAYIEISESIRELMLEGA